MTRPRKALPMRVGALTCLPAALAAILSGFTPGPAAAATVERAAIRALVESVPPGSPVVFKLKGGRTVSGQFSGFVGPWADTLDYATRYGAWRAAQPPGLPTLDQDLLVVLASGDTLRGAFRGVSTTFLVLGGTDPRFDIPVALDTSAAVRAASGDDPAQWSEVGGRLAGAPSIDAIGIELTNAKRNVLVSRDSIALNRSDIPPDNSVGKLVIALIGVTAIVLILGAVRNNAVESARDQYSIAPGARP